MDLKKGDIVTRISYKHDTIFKIINIQDNICYLKGENIRLYADSPIEDLQKYQKEATDDFEKNIESTDLLDRNEYFYLPAKILHCDGDNDYLNRCLNYYRKNKLKAIGKVINEPELPIKISKLLKDYNPDILILTGHDAYFKKKGSKQDLNNYKNSKYFCDAVKVARKYEKNHDKLVIIAGACQSDYEELIKCGANFASSPKRVNIHALDPAIIASTIALTNKLETINLIELLNKTKYGSDGMGGVIGNGLMYVGYPR
jgi:spore coat assembly protein